MGKIYRSIAEYIGSTPIVELKRIGEEFGLRAKLYAKVEYFNPTGSVKDRVALKMVENAIKEGKLSKGGTIIEPTSGNTGIGLASVAAAVGCKAVIVMPDTMSVERRNIIKAYGAEVVLTEGAKGMTGAIEKAEELNKEIPGSIIAGQFVNPVNIKAHYETTGPEIWEDTAGDIDAFIAGVGTGGTISGTGKYLKEKKNDIKIIAVEPLESNVLSGGKAGPHKIQGIGAGFIPEIYNPDIVDEIIAVKGDDCFGVAKKLATTEGILVGISSGAALKAGIEWAKRAENKGKKAVVLLPDSGDRYYSSPIFQD